MSKLSFLLFVMSSILNLLGHLIANELLSFYTKPFLMLTLVAYACLQLEGHGKLRIMLGFGLIASWLGDVFLLWGEHFLMFIAGLISFALAHVLYIRMFLDAGRTAAPWQVPKWMVIVFVLEIAFAFSYGSFLWDRIGEFRIPVMIYLLLIMTMSVASLLRWNATTRASFVWTVVGSLLFIFSDSSLAYAKFISPYPLSGFIIMSSYILAQWCITRGMVLHGRSASSHG